MLLLFATQLMLAAQLCHAVMLGPMPVDASRAMATTAVHVPGTEPLCCDATSLPATCPLATLASAADHWVLNTALQAGASLPVLGVSPASVPSCITTIRCPVSPTGPSPPAYVLFARFLS